MPSSASDGKSVQAGPPRPSKTQCHARRKPPHCGSSRNGNGERGNGEQEQHIHEGMAENRDAQKELNIRTVSRSLVAMTCDKKDYGRFRVTVYCDNCVLLSCESLLVDHLLACST